MKLKSIKYKVTTSKKKSICNKCGMMINGKEGFICIEYLTNYNFENSKIRICWECFSEFLKGCYADRKNRKEKYRELLKRRILRNLK